MNQIHSRIQNLNQWKINAVLFFHVTWVLVLYFGWPGIFFSRTYNIFYFAFVLFTFITRMVFKGDCVLTNVENDLRRKYSPETVYNVTDRCLPYYSEKWLKFRIKKPVIFTAFGFVMLLSFFNLFL